ncbi:hypothetical protein ACLMJK_004615 [Lecanora helva]
MNQSPSPLTPRSSNRNAVVHAERKSPYRSPSKPRFAQDDTENVPISSPNGPPSSPFVENVDALPAKADISPSKRRASQAEPVDEYQHVELTEDALRENEGLTRTVQVMEDEARKREEEIVEDDGASIAGGAPGYAGMDDTAFSAFSAVPNADMTRFARLSQSPTKGTFASPTRSHREEPTPRPLSRTSPSRSRHFDDGYSSPTPRRHRREKSTHDDDSTNLLVDFTGQFNPIAPVSDRSPVRNGRPSPRKYHNDLAAYASGKRTPSPAKYALPPSTPSESRHLANLLDFDLPPAPTPRSMPSISARELESMKSAFQSQISSLKAELSGKEAEVNSLKHAMGDAERRVGEAQEQVREERGSKEELQAEKTEWEKREQEMKDVLRSVKEEIMHSDREKDRLLQRATEAEYKREEAETKALEAESKMAGLQAAASSSPTGPSDPATNTPAQANTNPSAEIEAAVTKVAKELHGLYKSKHEAKVTALKKSYADRWEKKIKDLQSKLEELTKENEELRLGRDATITNVDPLNLTTNASSQEERNRQKEELEQLQERLTAQSTSLTTLEQTITTLRTDLATSTNQNTALRADLDASRAETADLIAATEELMTLSTNAMSAPEAEGPSAPPTRSAFSRSTSGTGLGGNAAGSGLKAPGFGSSGSGLRAPGGYGYGGGSVARERSGSGSGSRGAGKSGLLGNIERMGRGGGGGGGGH